MPVRRNTAGGAKLFLASALFCLTLPVAAGAQAHSSQTDVLPDAPRPAWMLDQDQDQGQGQGGSDPYADLSLLRTPQRLVHNEWHIIASPAHVTRHDLRWLLPLAAASAVAIATDTHTMQTVVSHNTQFNNGNSTGSDVVRDTLIGVPVLLFGAGELAHKDDARNTGLLAGEAMVNAYVTSEAIKYVTLRERPDIANARGHFFAGDAASDPTFVSGHSIVAWSSAAVLAGRYSRPWQQAGIYSAASAVSVMRVLGQQHFPSDVLLGSVAGWLIGHYVFAAHRSAFPHLHEGRASRKQGARSSMDADAHAATLSHE